MILRKMPRRVFGRIDLLPNDGSDKILLSEDLIHKVTQMVGFIVINTNKYRPVLPKHLS